jgi:hypothetical protein
LDHGIILANTDSKGRLKVGSMSVPTLTNPKLKSDGGPFMSEMKEVTIKLTEDQRSQIKNAIGQDITEVKVSADRGNPLAATPLTDRANPLMSELADRANPARLADRANPARLADRANPSFASEELADRANPTALADRANPTALADRANPTALADRANPTALADRANPTALADRANPTALADRANPTALADRANPTKIAD